MLGGAALAFLAIVSAALIIGPRLRSPDQAAADAAPPRASLVSVAAERRVLAEPVVLRGQIKAGASVKLLPPASAIGDASVVTKVAVTAGQVLGEGQVVIVRSGEPMFTLVLPFPLYRDLVGGLTGPDVTEVQRALGRLGYRTALSGVFDPATQQGLARFYTDRGYPAPAGSPDAVKQLPAATQAVADAQREYTATPTPAAKARLDQAKRALADAQLAAGPMLSRSAVLLLDRAGRKISMVGVRVGSVLTGGGAPVDTKPADPKPSAPNPASPNPEPPKATGDSGGAIVELDGEPAYALAVTDKDRVQLLKAGQAATVYDDSSGAKAAAKINTVGTQLVTGESGQDGFEVRFTFTGPPMDAVSGRSVRIDIPVAAGGGEVLAVPVTAVYSRTDGRTFVTVARKPGATSDVDVETGKIAGGWIEIRPTPADAVQPGTLVVVGGEQNAASPGKK